MSEWLLPSIDPARCDGCGRCVSSCPAGALAMRDRRAVIIWPEACTYTAQCEAVCPTAAIALPYEVIIAADPAPQVKGEAR